MKSVVILACPWRDPTGVLAAVADEPFAVALLSGGEGERSRWSYVAARPAAVLSNFPGDPADPVQTMRALLGEPAAGAPNGPPFQGGLIGLGCYELAARFEPLDLERRPGWPDLVCALYPSLLAFDHREQRILAVGRGVDSVEAERRAREAAAWGDGFVAPAEGPMLAEGLTGSSGPDYEAAVADVTARIAAGEIFQANIARSWRGRLRRGRRPFDLLNRLRSRSPAPFAAYLRLPGQAVVSNSPERFLLVRASDDGFQVESRPIKGTRPRGADAAEDTRLAAELMASPKDRAENLMIVDLMRNDLSRVCSKVEATDLFRPESFANVHHLVSTVTGTMRPGLSGIDAWAAAFPPGSITGAPKIQAMKVIAGLETPRGPYCGSLFWAGFDGALDSSVLIRTAVFDEEPGGWRIEARAGAGIVADSQPHEEALETEAKIAAIAGALAAEDA